MSSKWLFNEAKLSNRAEKFNRIQEEKRQKVFKLGDYKDTEAIYKGPVPYPLNPLNTAVQNLAL
jgi:hypothetical protein